MKHRKKKLAMFLCLLFMASSLSGCKTLLSALDSAFQKPKLEYKRMRLRDLSFRGLSMDFDFELFNPNAVAVTFTHFSYQLKVDGNELFKGVTKKNLEMKAEGRSPLTVPFSVEFQKFVKSLLAFFRAKDDVPYHLVLGVGFQTPIGEVILPPMNIRGRAPVPKVPKVRVVGVSMGSLSLSGTEVRFKLGVKNQGKFPVKVSGLNYNFQVSGVSIGSGNASMKPVGVGREQMMTIPLKINFFKVGMAIANVIRSRKLPYKMQGNLNLGLFKLPLQFSGNASL